MKIINLYLPIIISAISLLLSFATCVYNIVSRRKKLRFSILEYRYENNENRLLLSIENCSQLAISISKIILKIVDKEYECKRIPSHVKSIQHFTKGSIELETVTSLSFPIVLDSLGGVGGFVVFANSPQISEDSETLLIFQVYTNRGKVKSIKVPLRSTCPRHIA